MVKFPNISREKQRFMKNRKAYAIICWIVSVMGFLAALLISEGKMENLTKQVIFGERAAIKNQIESFNNSKLSFVLNGASRQKIGRAHV